MYEAIVIDHRYFLRCAIQHASMNFGSDDVPAWLQLTVVGKTIDVHGIDALRAWDWLLRKPAMSAQSELMAEAINHLNDRQKAADVALDGLRLALYLIRDEISGREPKAALVTPNLDKAPKAR
jgi:hypothetical protein